MKALFWLSTGKMLFTDFGNVRGKIMRRLLIALICALGAWSLFSLPVAARSGAQRAQPQSSDPFGDLFGGFDSGPVAPGQDGRPQAVAVPRETVAFDAKYAPGTVVISTNERRLYYVMGNGQAIRYGVGVGRPGFEWSGTRFISSKREWPDWTPPAQMLRRRPDLPRHMEGGVDNPLGARAMYLSGTLYRIHGSNEPETIGQAVSSGCIRMTNDDVIDLYNRVHVGTRVVVMRD
jgi:lipoprotein-anchoring transpeptidase ErfK/SrfK